MPPFWAMAMASRLSVTVSIAADTSGMFSLISRVNRVATSTWVGMTSEGPGSSKTSSKVRPSRISMETPRFARLVSLQSGRVSTRLEPQGHQIELRALRPAGLGLHRLHLGEPLLQAADHLGGLAALEGLGDEGAARLQHLDGELGGGLDQADDAQVVGLAVADGVRGHVGEHHVGRAAQQADQLGPAGR